MQKSWAKKREAEINFAGHVEMTFIDDGDVQTHAKSIKIGQALEQVQRTIFSKA